MIAKDRNAKVYHVFRSEDIIKGSLDKCRRVWGRSVDQVDSWNASGLIANNHKSAAIQNVAFLFTTMSIGHSYFCPLIIRRFLEFLQVFCLDYFISCCYKRPRYEKTISSCFFFCIHCNAFEKSVPSLLKKRILQFLLTDYRLNCLYHVCCVPIKMVKGMSNAWLS